METLFAVLRIVVVAYVGLCLWLFFKQASYVYYPYRELTGTPQLCGMDYDDVVVETEDGEKISAWYVPVEEARGTVLVCHGNGGNISDRLSTIHMLHRLGFNVCIFDYRGYGSSTGRPTEEGTYRDALAMWRYVTEEKGATPKELVLFGRSLGGAVATWLAVEKGPGALVLDSTFTSIPDMAATLYPYLPIRLLCRFKYDTHDKVQNVPCPVLVAHSVDDETIPYAQGRRVYEAAPEPKRFLEMDGGHNEDRSAQEDYVKTIDDFLKSASI